MKWLLYLLLVMPYFAHALCTDMDDVNQKQACAIEANKQADKDLNQIYKLIRKALNKEQKNKLKQAQVAWLKFRDANCEHQVSASLEDHITIKNICLAQVTQRRTQELQNIYSHLFIGYTPVDYAATTSLQPTLSEQTLVGSWKSQTDEYGVVLQFQLIDDKAVFSSTLNNQQFETGGWQFSEGQLMITNEQDEILYLYNQVTLENDVLTLYEKEGGIEKYQRIKNQQ